MALLIVMFALGIVVGSTGLGLILLLLGMSGDEPKPTASRDDQSTYPAGSSWNC
jgi:hypothetical protein